MHKRVVSMIAGAVVLLFSLLSTTSWALPIAPKPAQAVAGIPTPCLSHHPWPGDDVSISEIKKGLTDSFGFGLTGNQWTSERLPSIKILWQTLDAMDCTGYLTDLQNKVNGNVGINAASISGYAWGDWSLTKYNYVSLDFSKFQQALDDGDEGRLVRLVAHELAHVLNADRFQNPEYWQDFKDLYAAEGTFSDYGAGSLTETFADVVGYYVGRCALDNPYDTGKFSAYYEFTKERIFRGKEFGPAAGTKPNCSVPAADAEPPVGARQVESWVNAVSQA